MNKFDALNDNRPVFIGFHDRHAFKWQRRTITDVEVLACGAHASARAMIHGATSGTDGSGSGHPRYARVMQHFVTAPVLRLPAAPHAPRC